MRCANSRALRWAFLWPFLFALCACEVNTFPLAAESRLPIWFQLPAGRARSDVSVTISFIQPGERVELVVQDKSGKELGHVTATFEWHPETKERMKTYGGLEGHRRLMILRSGGSTEIFEQGDFGQPLYINDDPALRVGIR